MSNIPTVPLFIGGEPRQSKSGATYDVVNPATSKVIEHAAAATAEDVYVSPTSSATAGTCID